MLMPIFSASAGIGWFAIVSFRTPPDRVVVNVYDESGQLRTTTVSLGGDPSGIGFYLQNANGTFYTQDTRNPGARAQALWYAGTGINNGTLFLAWEDQAQAQGADSDFDDVVVYLEPPWPGRLTTPCERTSWGVLKARFR